MIYKIPYKKLRKNAKAPVKSHHDDEGFDLSVSTISVTDDGMQISYGCGLAFDLSEVKSMLVIPRSGICKYGVMLSNSCGLIDAGYRGEVSGKFIVVNKNKPIYTYGDRFMQMIFPRLGVSDSVEFVEVDELSAGSRGENGFGSTGK